MQSIATIMPIIGLAALLAMIISRVARFKRLATFQMLAEFEIEEYVVMKDELR